MQSQSLAIETAALPTLLSLPDTFFCEPATRPDGGSEERAGKQRARWPHPKAR